MTEIVMIVILSGVNQIENGPPKRERERDILTPFGLTL